MIWNLADSSSALIDEDTKIDGYFIKSDGYKDVVLPLMGALDPVRAAKYEAENWSDLTVEELAENVPYFDSVMSVNVEDGTASELTIENRRDDPDGEAFCSIVIPDTIELHGFGGVFNEWSNNQYTKRISMTTKATDESGNFTLSGYKSGTQVIVMKDSTGEVQILDAAASVSTGWNETACTIWYVLSTPVISEAKATGGLYLYEGQNNILSPDSKLPASIMISHTGEDTAELLAFVRNFSANARSESIRFKPHFSTKKRTILTRRGYEISFDDPIIDGDWDLRQFEDTRFTIIEELGSEKIKYHGCAISELESSDDDIVVHKVKLVAETKEVV